MNPTFSELTTLAWRIAILYGAWVWIQFLILKPTINYIAWHKTAKAEGLPWNWRVLVGPERYFDWLTKQIVEANDLDDWLDQIRKSDG